MKKELNYFKGFYKVLKSLNGEIDLQITKPALLLLNNMIIRLGKTIIIASNHIVNSANKKLISTKDIKTTIRIVFKEDLAQHAISEGVKSVIKYNYNRKDKKGKKIKTSREKDANLVFKISTTQSLFSKNIKKINSVYYDAIVYVTAVLEYIAAELLELSGNSAKSQLHNRITPRDIFNAISNDDELGQLFNGYILGTGVKHNIDDKLKNGGGFKRYKIKKFLRDNVYGITKPGLKRLMYRAGVKYISGLIYGESREIIKDLITKILSVTTAITERKGHKTVTYEDGVEALNLLNISIYNVKGFPGMLSPCKGSENISKLLKNKSKNAERRKKPKINILKIIDKYQKTSCTLMPHLPFARFIREIGQDFKSDLMYQKEFMWLVHAVVESYMVDLYQKTLLVALHSNRLTIMPKDIQLVLRFDTVI